MILSDVLQLKSIRTTIDKKYVGVSPLSGNAIKPVHIADGVYRVLEGNINKSRNIHCLAIASNDKGIPLKNHDLDTVYNTLLDAQKLDEDIKKEDLESFRNALQRLLNADGGVFVSEKSGMVSYSAGSKYFIPSHALYEEGGEFMGSVLKVLAPDLSQYIKSILESGTDPITLLFQPLLEEEDSQIFEALEIEEIPAFKDKSKIMEMFKSSIRISSETLVKNLKIYPNDLTKLRIFNLYVIFHYFRYISLLGSFYCDEPIHPILLDFSGMAPSQSSVARASEFTFTQVYKTLNRFYSWAFSQELLGYSKEDLLDLPSPVYEFPKKKKKKKQDDNKESDIIWDIAKQNLNSDSSIEDIRSTLGEAMYDIVAKEASGTPINYLKALGTKSGILLPPDNNHPNKRFAISRDVLEMLILSCVNPKEVISKAEIRRRFWERFNCIVGGSVYELNILEDHSIFLQVDEDALEANFNAFSEALENMDFAEILADGILKIRTGGTNYD